MKKTYSYAVLVLVTTLITSGRINAAPGSETIKNRLVDAVWTTELLYDKSADDLFNAAAKEAKKTENKTKHLVNDCSGDTEIQSVNTDLPTLISNLKNKNLSDDIRKNDGLTAANNYVNDIVNSTCWSTYNPTDRVRFGSTAGVFSFHYRASTSLSVSTTLNFNAFNTVTVKNLSEVMFDFKNLEITYQDGSVVSIDGKQVAANSGETDISIPSGVITSVEIKGGIFCSPFYKTCTLCAPGNKCSDKKAQDYAVVIFGQNL